MRTKERERIEESWTDRDDFYDGSVIAEMLEDDELSIEEEAFMRGYERYRRERLHDFY